MPTSYGSMEKTYEKELYQSFRLAEFNAKQVQTTS